MKYPDLESAFLLTRLESVVAFLSVFKMFNFGDTIPNETSPAESIPHRESHPEAFVYGVNPSPEPLMACESTSKENEYRV